MYGSRGLPDFLARHECAIAFSAMQVGKLFLVGAGSAGKLSVFERSFRRCAALHAAGDDLYLATDRQVWHLRDFAVGEASVGGHDRLYVPLRAWTTGDLDIHDIHRDTAGRIRFVSTRFSCIAGLSAAHSFAPLWQPPFVSRLAPEDRCHLNGFAVRGDDVSHATAFAASDVGDGWRERRLDGGILLSIPDGDVVLEGLCMPHTPRWHAGRLWLLESGTGRFGYLDPVHGRFEAAAFCPGFARGLDFIGDYALIGVSSPRDEATFRGLPVAAELERRGSAPRCGLLVVDTRSGDVVEWLRVEGLVREIHAVSVLRGTRNPAAVGLLDDGMLRTVSIAPPEAL